MPRIRPTDLTFSIKAQYRPFEIVAAGFEAVDDPFDRRVSSTRFAPAPERDAGTARVANGVLAISGRPSSRPASPDR